MEQICQSCGMPMVATEHFGTNRDKSVSRDYCCFCFKEGAFTDSFSFYEFVEDAVKSFGSEHTGEDVSTENERILKGIVQLQELKRWRSHQSTHQEYYRSVNRVVEFIREHLQEPIQLSSLAWEAGISEFHFHRIFKAILGESPGDYIQRLRLEKAAFKLQISGDSLTEIAEQTGYQSSQALAKAFKKRFGMTPKEFRCTPADLTNPVPLSIVQMEQEPEIRQMDSIRLLYTPVKDAFSQEDAFLKAWDKLIDFVQINSCLPQEKYDYYCVSRDISTITHPDHCRIYVCIHIPEPIPPKGNFGIQTLEGGKYAVFTHKGAHRNMEALYCHIYRHWLPNSSYCLRDSLHFEKYLYHPGQNIEEDLLTEIYIPVETIGS